MTPKEAVCEQCGAPLKADARFCEQCGATVAAPEPTDEPATMEWVATLSLLQNKTVVTQLGLVLFIPLAILACILIAINQPSGAEEWGVIGQIVLLTGGIFLGLMLIAVLLVYGGRYEYEFQVNHQGIRGRPHGRTAKKNRIINFLLMFSGKPTATGAGLLAQARQEEYVAWNDFDKVVADEKNRTITLQKGKRPLMVIPCDQEHYAAVLEMAQEAAARTRSRRREHNPQA